MKFLARLNSDDIDIDRVLCFSLPLLRSGPLLPLKPTAEAANPVAVCDTAVWPWALLDDCRRVFAAEVDLVLVPKDVLLTNLNQVFDMASASAEQMLEDLDDELGRELEEIGDLLESEDDAPVIRLVNTLISQALKERASDIHIEPFHQEVLVRFRVDGLLHTIVKPPKSVQAAMISRIKVMADLDISEKRHPQDGRFRVKIAGREVDIRVSILPTAHGERVVMRLLDRGAKMLSLTELGMSASQLQMMQEVVTSAHGIVLVTGPTGSGKSTTLYAALMQVDRCNRNVMTIEDPIEYQIEGVAQMQVQAKIGVSFAAGLRSILRQDPDIVMVGEIRDLETAEIAIQASLTGHLVFATLHTNDSLSAVLRLQDMGIESYLLASSLIMVQAQRLVRRLCVHCRKPIEARPEYWRSLHVSSKDFAHIPVIYTASGCEKCLDTGYFGRLSIYEMLRMSEPISDAIHAGAGLPAMRALAKQQGMLSLRQDGARHVAEGLTTIDEILRVSMEDGVVVDP